MKRIILTIAVASLAIGGIAVAQTRAPAHHQARAEAEEGDEADEAEDNAALAARAKLTLVQAQDIALRARAGEVKTMSWRPNVAAAAFAILSTS